ncbi:hypothetical protein HXX76_008757 [Chlamydomonas incerta]|uniref:Uncharacterized protein n=1 Tax=Chlamydomonas incerta TaxID=51695 RepID=A0A835VYW4_CHLIN|nr:hypothetical protein HXX76_008757 [Chlamydomonas incerta]|eukprot:KAG2433030.1 hypothetical protein HXX76_008757 [Chlamydomonas incerta]
MDGPPARSDGPGDPVTLLLPGSAGSVTAGHEPIGRTDSESGTKALLSRLLGAGGLGDSSNSLGGVHGKKQPLSPLDDGLRADSIASMHSPHAQQAMADDVGVESLPPLPAGAGGSPMRLSTPGNGAGRTSTISFTPDTAANDAGGTRREGASQRELNAVSSFGRVGSLKSLACDSVADLGDYEPVHSARSSASFGVAERPNLIKEMSMKQKSRKSLLGPAAHQSNSVGGGQPQLSLSPLPQPQKLSNSGAVAPSPGLGANGANGANGRVLSHMNSMMAAAPAATLGSPAADLRARRTSAPGQNLLNGGMPESGPPNGSAARLSGAGGAPAVTSAGRFGAAAGGGPKKGFLFVEEENDKDARGGAGMGKAQQEPEMTGKAAVAALKLRQEAAAGMKGGGRHSASGEAAGGAVYSVPPIPTAEWFDMMGPDGGQRGAAAAAPSSGGMCGCFGGGGQVPPQVAQQRKWWRARLRAALQAADDEEVVDWISFHNSKDGPARDAPELNAVLWLCLELPQPGAAPQLAKLLLRGGASPNAPRPAGPPGSAAASGKPALARGVSQKGMGGSLGPGGVNWLSGLTPLMRAAELASPALVELLLAAGADAAAAQPGSGLTALHRALLATPPDASASGAALGVKSALKKASADVSASGDLEALPAYRCARLLLDRLGLERAGALRAAGGAAGSSAGVGGAGDFGLVRFARRHGRPEAARWLLGLGLEDEPEPELSVADARGGYDAEPAAARMPNGARPGAPGHAGSGPRGAGGGTDSGAAPALSSPLMGGRNSVTGGGPTSASGGMDGPRSAAIAPAAAPSPMQASNSKRSMLSVGSSKRLMPNAEQPGSISLVGVAARASGDGGVPLLHKQSSNGSRPAGSMFGGPAGTSAKQLLQLRTAGSLERGAGTPLVLTEAPENQEAKLQSVLDTALRTGRLEPLEEALALPHLLTQAAAPPNSGIGSGGASTEALAAAATAASHLAAFANGRLELVRQLLAKASSASASGDAAAGAGAAAAVRYYLVAKAAVLEAAATAHGRAADFYTAAGRQSEAVDGVLAAKQREANEFGLGEELSARCQAAVVKSKTTRDTVVAAIEQRRDAHAVAVDELLEKRLAGLSDASKMAEAQAASMIERMIESVGVEVARREREIEDARHEAASRMMMMERQLDELGFRKQMQMQMARDSGEARAAFNMRLGEYRKDVQAQRKALQQHLDDAARALDIQSKRVTTRAKTAGGWRGALSKRQQALAWEARNAAAKIKEAIAERAEQLLRTGRIPHLLLSLGQLGSEVTRNATTANAGVNKTCGALLARAAEARQSLGGWVTVGRQEMQEHLSGLVSAHSKTLEQIMAAGPAGVGGGELPRMPPAPDTARNLQSMDAAATLREYNLRDMGGATAEGEARAAAAAALADLPRQLATVDEAAEEVIVGCNEQIREALPEATLVDGLSLEDFGPLLDHAAEELLGLGLEALLAEEMGLRGGLTKVELQLPTLNMDELVKPLDLNLADVDQGAIDAQGGAGGARRTGWADGAGGGGGGGGGAGAGGMPPAGYGMPPYGMPPPGYGMPPPGYGMPPPGYGMPPPGYGMPPYGMPPPGYGMPPPGYGMPGPHAAWGGGWYGPPHHGYGHHGHHGKAHDSDEDEVMSDGGNRHGGNKDHEDWGMSYS